MAGTLAGPKRIGPVAIGGVGGSGTRVVAEIVRGLGIHIGDDLNYASDNRLYTLLFKRPRWFRANWRDPEAAGAHLRILERSLTGHAIIRIADMRALIRAAREMSRYGHTPEGQNRGPVWSLKRIARAMLPRLRPDPAIGWGWKEPNTHLVLDHLAREYPDLRYIHVIRHGLDMAFSDNRQQVQNWARLFDLPGNGDPAHAGAVNALRFWIRANDRVLALGDALGPRRFLLLRIEEVCAEPRQAAETIARFIGAPADRDRLDRLAALPRMPRSVGRYRDEDISAFAPDELQALTRFGYSV